MLSCEKLVNPTHFSRDFLIRTDNASICYQIYRVQLK